MSSSLLDEHEYPQAVTILYATETGTAQETADRIAYQCRRLHLHARVCNMDTYSPVSNAPEYGELDTS